MNCIKIIYKEENGKVTINEVDKYIINREYGHCLEKEKIYLSV